MVAGAPNGGPGPAVDALGRPAVDPTENVKALNEASIKAQRDLIDLDRVHIKDMLEQRRYYEDLLRQADRELRQAESDRLDSIRAVDIAAVQRSTQEASERANTLATQVATAADVVRTTLAAGLDPIRNDIADLRRSQSEAAGQKTQVVEGRSAAEELKPMFDQLHSLLLAQAASQGAKVQVAEGRGTTNYVTGLIGFGIAAVLGLAAIIALNPDTSTPDPVVVEVPVESP